MIIEKLVFWIVGLFFLFNQVYRFVKDKNINYLFLFIIQLVSIITLITAKILKIETDIFIQIYILLINYIVPTIVLCSHYSNVDLSEFFTLKLGDHYYRKNKYEAALKCYKKALSKNLNSAKIYSKLGIVYNCLGDRRTAFDRFVKAVELDRNDFKSYYEIGLIFNDMGKFQDAQIVLDNVLRIRPNYTPASELLGNILFSEQKYNEAVTVYKNALKYDKENYQLYYNIAVAKSESKDLEEAKYFYEKAIELNPTLYEGYFNLGQINLIKGELSNAEKMFKNCLLDDALKSKSYYQLAKVYMLNKLKDDALTFIGYAINADSSLKFKAESDPMFESIRNDISKITIKGNKNKKTQMVDYADNTNSDEENVEELLSKIRVKKDEVTNIIPDSKGNFDDDVEDKYVDNVEEITKTQDEINDTNIDETYVDDYDRYHKNHPKRNKIDKSTQKDIENIEEIKDSSIHEIEEEPLEKEDNTKIVNDPLEQIENIDEEDEYVENTYKDEEYEIRKKKYLEEVKDYDKKEQKNSSSKDNKALNFLKKFLGFEDDEEEIENEFAYENEFSNQVRKVKSPTNYKEKEIENNNENIKPVEDNNKNDIKEEYKEYGEIFNKNDDFTKDDLDIFEKFKKLKAEEEEKAKKIRAREKARQLEELKRQEEEAKNARYAQNYEETFGEPPTSKVRVVGKVETEEAKEELKKVKELSKKRNFELEYNDDNKSKKKKSDNDKYIKKTSKPNCAKNVDKVTEDDYNFESHSPVEEDDQDTGFDFLDKYKD